jgi:hypothetical protein
VPASAVDRRAPPHPTSLIPPELLDGRPHGDEGELLQHFEAEVDSSVAELRQLKAANEETQAAIVDVLVRKSGTALLQTGLKRLVADLSLEKQVLKDIASGNL